MAEEKINSSGEVEPDESREPSSETEAPKEEILSAIFDESGDGEEIERRPRRQISLKAFLISTVALILAAVMATYTLTSLGYRKKLAEAELDNVTSGESVEDVRNDYYPFELFDAFFKSYSLSEVDREEMLEMALKAYVYATGDRYAAYYTDEELKALNASSEGSSEGIGINIIQDEADVGGVPYKVLRVVNVMEGSPALAAGMRVGDMICTVGLGESAETINALGYDIALNKLVGKAGTLAEFYALRPTEDGYETLEFSIERAAVTTTSVKALAVDWQGKRVGVVKILQFDLTTPAQFKSEMSRLLSEGCTHFVYDVRNNPGGDLRSIEAVLSYFLEKDDVIIRVKDAKGEEEISYVKAVQYTDATYAGCSVSEEEIGMYRSYPSVVLCNESTASAAELFTATFRDYGLAPTLGVNTYGKGTMQQTFSLFYYGVPGALKLTVAMYCPAGGENYDGVGIAPTHTVEPSEELRTLTSFEINAEKDNQLSSALDLLTR